MGNSPAAAAGFPGGRFPYRERFTRWWSDERAGPLLQLEGTRPGPPPVHPGWAGTDPWWFTMRWLDATRDDPQADPAPLLAVLDAHLASRMYFGDAVPQVWLNLGPGVLAAYLTGHLDFRTGTSWFELPAPLGWEAIARLRLRHDAPWWLRTRRLADRLARHAAGRYEVGTTDLGGVLDVLASLRTTDRLLEDCLEAPDRILQASRHLLGPWHACYNELDGLLGARGQHGRAAWMGLWSARRWYPLQCDFCAMLSPAMTARLVVPVLRDQCRRLDDPVYHWDGPGQVPHLDLLLAIPELKAIQWVPGASAPQSGDPRWFPLYRKILAAGKRLILNNGVTPRDVPVLLKECGGRGLLLATEVADAREADALLALAR